MTETLIVLLSLINIQLAAILYHMARLKNKDEKPNINTTTWNSTYYGDEFSKPSVYIDEVKK